MVLSWILNPEILRLEPPLGKSLEMRRPLVVVLTGTMAHCRAFYPPTGMLQAIHFIFLKNYVLIVEIILILPFTPKVLYFREHLLYTYLQLYRKFRSHYYARVELKF